MMKFIAFIFIYSSRSFKINAQGFNLTSDPSDIDSLLKTRIDISAEDYYLFDYLTKFKYFDYNELNEFVKKRQLEDNQKIKKKFEGKWGSRYLITFKDKVINSREENYSFLYLHSYDFNKSLFAISFGKIPIEIFVDKSINEKQKIIAEEKLPKNIYIKEIILELQLDKEQAHSYSLPIPVDRAEILKNKLIDNLF